MDAPPPEVMTAILRGGPYDGIVFEIEEGQSEISPRPLVFFTGPAPPDATYRYSGDQDDDGNAIFGPVTT